jgi:hypothetical protein
MALPILTWPLLQAAYSFQDAPRDTTAVQLDGVMPGYRANVAGASASVSVTWALKGTDRDDFFGFYQVVLADGSLPFQISLILDDDEPTDHMAYFVPDSLNVVQVSVDEVSVTATLDVAPIPYDMAYGQAYVMFYNEWGTAWESILPPLEDSFNTLMNVSFPGAMA